MTYRRQFISRLTLACAFAYLPLQTRDLFASVAYGQDTIIDAVEIVRVTGSFKSKPGFNRQPQAKPIDIYPEYHPAPYSDNPSAI